MTGRWRLVDDPMFISARRRNAAGLGDLDGTENMRVMAEKSEGHDTTKKEAKLNLVYHLFERFDTTELLDLAWRHDS